MKKLILLLCVLGTFALNAQSSINEGFGTSNAVTNEVVVNWQSSFKQAVMRAKAEKKPVLIYFTGSDWCGPCKRLDKELFQTEKFKAFADKNLVLYKADYPINVDLVSPENKVTNSELSKRYSQKSFPTMIVINSKGEVLGRKNGKYMSEFYYPFFEEVIKK